MLRTTDNVSELTTAPTMRDGFHAEWLKGSRLSEKDALLSGRKRLEKEKSESGGKRAAGKGTRQRPSPEFYRDEVTAQVADVAIVIPTVNTQMSARTQALQSWGIFVPCRRCRDKWESMS
jgi:hypothetical protein